MIRFVWSVVATCQPPPEAERTALRVLRDHWPKPLPPDPRGRGVRAVLVAALRTELGPTAESAITHARIHDERTIGDLRRPGLLA
ncbi:hypothetical protein GCM10022243_55700 [Saccharothrix violaceirubra]